MEECDNPGSHMCRATSRVQSDFNATAVPPFMHPDCQGAPPGSIIPVSAEERERRKARDRDYARNYRETHRGELNKKARENPKEKEYNALYQEAHKPQKREKDRVRHQRNVETKRKGLEERLKTTADPEERRDIKGMIDRSDEMKKRQATGKAKQGAENLATMGGHGWHVAGPDDFEGRVKAHSQRRQREDSDSEPERERQRKRREKEKKGDSRRR